LHNLYGPTEATVDVTAWSFPGEFAGGRVPIGRPIANTQIYVLDEWGSVVPEGVSGELYIGGVQIGRGYVGLAALTAERFIPDPYGKKAGARMYRTGDLGRWLPDGNIEFLGRNDQQVKIRGFRIELGEIEARLGECEGVGEAVVVMAEDAVGDKRLVAYYTGAGEGIKAEILRRQLMERLPEYMVPVAYVRLERMPLTANGKLDRKGLPAPESEDYGVEEYEEPQGEREKLVAGLWAELLGVERVGRRDNFFALGGHSLLAVTLMERMRRKGLRVDVRAIFTAPTVAGLVAEEIQEIRI